MNMKKTFVGKKISDMILKSRSKREHNLIGAWQGKKTKVLKNTGDKTIVEGISQFTDSLKVNTDFRFSWSKAKTGLIQFRNDYSLLVFKTQQMLGLDQSQKWEIKRLTFNKLVLIQHNEDSNTLTEYHFEKDLREYNVG